MTLVWVNYILLLNVWISWLISSFSLNCQYYQNLFNSGECFLHILSLLNGSLDESIGEQLLLNVLQTLTLLLMGNDDLKVLLFPSPSVSLTEYNHLFSGMKYKCLIIWLLFCLLRSHSVHDLHSISVIITWNFFIFCIWLQISWYRLTILVVL